jgi:aspartate--ammonia ligase
MKLQLPKEYNSKLSVKGTERAILLIKSEFERLLSTALSLVRVSAPLFVRPETGLNDNLNGVEMPVSFKVSDIGCTVQIVQSLAKWKRMALLRYGFGLGTGIYTDMNAIRMDEELTNMHSVYVDQWDWEKVISPEMRTLAVLKNTVTKIVGAICDTLDIIKEEYPQIDLQLSRDVHFATTQELEDEMPDLTPKEREDAVAKKYGTVCVMQIGDRLKSGNIHDQRAPDYDDWALNCDIVFWNDVLGRAFEISSMGIRVDERALDVQLSKSGCDDRRTMDYHRMLLQGKLPLTMGGGIGQSRLCMLLTQKAHIGEVQVSVWHDEMLEQCRQANIFLL